MTPRIIIGISGASGFQYGVKALELLQPLPLEVHLVVSKGAEKTCELETDFRLDEVMAMADVVHPIGNLGAAISSGSFKTLGMLVAPCSMRTLGAIAHCLTDNLLTRAADVVLKEGRKLVLVPREMPLSTIHLENMLALSRMGVAMVPPMPAYYNHPQTADDITQHIVTRVLDQFGLEHKKARRWNGLREAKHFSQENKDGI